MLLVGEKKVEKSSDPKKKSYTPICFFVFWEKSDLQLFDRKIPSKFGLQWILIEIFAAIMKVLFICF